MAPMKQADHPMPSSCSGLLPGRPEPGAASLTSMAPSLERPLPLRPPVTWVCAV